MSFDALRNKDKFYVCPNIPRDKAQNAINAYCGNVDYNDVLVVLDETVFGSCKCGATLTTSSVFFKEDFEKEKAFFLDDIYSCYAKKGLLGCAIYVNDNKVLGITQASYADVSIFCECVMQASQLATNDDDYDVDDENQITLKRYPKDNIFKTIKDIEDSFIKSVFSVNSFGGSLGASIKNYVWPMLCFIRTNYIDKSGFVYFQNDIASLEIITGLLALLSARLKSMAIRDDVVLHVLKEGVRGALESNDMSKIAQIAFHNSDDQNYELIIIGMMASLLLSNIRGQACLDLSEDENMETIALFIANNGGKLLREASSDEEFGKAFLLEIHKFFEKNLGLSVENKAFMNKMYREIDGCAEVVMKNLKEQYGGF